MAVFCRAILLTFMLLAGVSTAAVPRPSDQLELLPGGVGAAGSDAAAGDHGVVVAVLDKFLTVRWRRTGRKIDFPLSTWSEVLKITREGRALRAGDELELLPGGSCGAAPQGTDAEHQCRAGDRGRAVEASDTLLRIVWYTSGITTESTDAAWYKTFWLSAEARTLDLGDMLRPLPGVAFGEGPGPDAEDGTAQGCVIRTSDQVTTVLVYKTGSIFEIPAATWYEHTIFVRTGSEFHIGTEVQLIPNQGFAIGSSVITDGMKGRVVEAPAGEAGPTEVLRLMEGTSAVLDGSARRYIVKRAWWGVRDKEWQVGLGTGIDVTVKVRELLGEGRTVKPSSDILTDPALDVMKQLSIEIFREGVLQPMFYVACVNEGQVTVFGSKILEQVRQKFLASEANVCIGMSLYKDLEDRRLIKNCVAWDFDSRMGTWQCEQQKSWRWPSLTGMNTRQSSTHVSSGGPDYCCGSSFGADGNIKTDMHTLNQENPWWEVDLGHSHRIIGLRVYNIALETRHWRLNGFNVLVDGVACATDVQITWYRDVVCLAVGRVVRIELPRVGTLVMSEVMVATAEEEADVKHEDNDELIVRSDASMTSQVEALHVEDLHRKVRADYLTNHKVHVAWYELGIITPVEDVYRRLQVVGKVHSFSSGDEIEVLNQFELTSPDGTVYGHADCKAGDLGRVRLTKASDVLQLSAPDLCSERGDLLGIWEKQATIVNGRPYYKARSAMAFLFSGVGCTDTVPRWWIAPRRPSDNASQSLASGDGCAYWASMQLDVDAMGVPEDAAWKVVCGGEWVSHTITFEEAPMLEATWYRTGMTTRCPLAEWASHFKLVSQAYVPELGKQFRSLPPLPEPQHADDMLQHVGRVILKDPAQDVLQFKMFSGDIVTTKLSEWFLHFVYEKSVSDLRIFEEVEALPASQWCEERGDVPCPITAKLRGRVARLDKARFTVVWFGVPSLVVTNHSMNTWYHHFRRTNEAHSLVVGDEVECVVDVAVKGMGGLSRSHRVERGVRGRIFGMDPLEPTSAMVAWYSGAESRVDVDAWMWDVKWVAPAVVLSPFIELEVLPHGMNVSGVELQLGLKGRVVSIGKGTYDVMWYSGERLTYEADEWLRQFKYVGEGHHMELGDEVEALPGMSLTGVDGLVYDGGHRGRVVNADKEKYSVMWVGSGIQSHEDQECWSCRFRWTGKKAPKLAEGMELKVLPRSMLLSRPDCEEIYMPGWAGRIYSYEALTGELCVRWYEISSFTCFTEPSWIHRFELLDEVHLLTVGDELALINGEGCPVEVSVNSREPPEDNEMMNQEVRLDDRLVNTEFGEMVPWFVPSEFLSRFAGGRGSQVRLLAEDGAKRSLDPMETCKEATLVNKPGQFVIRFESRVSAADRGRIYSIKGDTFCIMWYLGKASCASLGRWYRRFQLTGQAPHLANGSVVEALPIDGAEAAWNTTRFTWGEVTQVDQENNLLCVTWGTDVQQTCVQGLGRWPTSLRFVNRTRLDAQTYDVSQYDIVKVAKVTDALRNSSEFFALGNISEGSEGFISFIDDRDFCVSWKAKKCCTCHPKLELSDLTFAVVRDAKQSQKGDEWWWDCSEQERKPSDTCLPLTAADRLPVEVPGKGANDWLVPVVIVLLCAAAVAAVFVIRAKTKQADVEEADVIDEVELAQTTQEVHIAGLSDAWGVVSEAVVCGSAMGTSQSAALDNNGSVKVAMLSKFNNENDGMVPCLKSGEPGAAAKGVVQFLRIESKMALFHKDGLQAIVEEWEQALEDLGEKEEHNNVPEDKRLASKFLGLLKYIVEQEADEIEELSNDGVSTVTRDTGNKGKKLADFHAMSESTKANLSLPEVAALRIYTSSLFRLINEPFREPVNRDGFVEPHPVGITVYAISEGLKKLRGLYAYGEATNSKVSFWRGMKDLQLPETFMDQGGTELQCMSTTTDLSVASAYGLSKRPLLFCIKSDNFMTRGADISWLSLYPHEKEILYPPLTYLKPIGQRRIQNSEGLVVYVTPHLS